jgi:tRNA G18 (ribose-2'-O)-methylase SpoU
VESEKVPIVIVLDNVRSLHNVGSVFRTADSFLVEAVYLCGITAKPPHREIQKTALGATESIAWRYFNTTMEALEELLERGYKLVAVEQVNGSVELSSYEINVPIPHAIIFGHEVSGISQEVLDRCDTCIEIQQYGTKHSLNISVAAGIVMWVMAHKMSGK